MIETDLCVCGYHLHNLEYKLSKPTIFKTALKNWNSSSCSIGCIPLYSQLLSFFFSCSQIATSLLQTMCCKGMILQEGLFLQTQHQAGKCPSSLLLPLRVPPILGRQAECSPQGKAERAPVPPPGCRENEAPHRKEKSRHVQG